MIISTLAMILRIIFYWVVGLILHSRHGRGFEQTAKYQSVHVQDMLSKDVFIAENEYGEIVVTYTGRGSDLRPGDIITHADTIRILSGGLSTFVGSGEAEVMVPVVDENEEKQGGKRLLSFIKLEEAHPRKVKARRGELAMDLEEGGAAPSVMVGNIVVGPGGAKHTTDKNYTPPPHGGGECVTSRDCNKGVGICVAGKCECDKKKHPSFTGSYCQLDRPDIALTRKIEDSLKKSSNPFTVGAAKTNEVKPKPVAAAAGPSQEELLRQQLAEQQMREQKEQQAKEQQMRDEQLREQQLRDQRMREQQEQQQMEELLATNNAAAAPGAGSQASQQQQQEGSPSEEKKKRKKKPPAGKTKPSPEEATSGSDSSASGGDKGSEVLTFDDLYGPGKAYPTPYVAGKLSNQEQLVRYHKRYGKEPFLFTVRFREAPLGITFDNKNPTATIVERVDNNKAADQSDIKAGDQLVAVETFNTTLAPAKATQRILSTLDWPRTLVFKAKVNLVDPNAAANKVKSRTFNMTVIYPPTLTTELQFRLSEWTPALDLSTPSHPALTSQGLTSLSNEQFCPVFRMRAAADASGCKQEEGEFLLADALHTMMESRDRGAAALDWDTEQVSPMFSLLVQESRSRNLYVEPRSLGIVKRGECTFVEKARSMMRNGASLGLVVNNENELMDMPSGKEKVADITMPLGIAKEGEASLLHLSAKTNDVWVVLSDPITGLSPACDRIINLAEDLIDKWPHSVPAISTAQILQNKPPDTKPRGLTEEGGRIAISGENGWAFFDYHLAMFGPQTVPLGPFRLQMALPPFGCDPGAYTVRIKDTVVAILRGGGCSFGIKVINAQKLGAKAVIIVNTDDMKTMRLMALPDEVPLIQIPCIMVSRRIQFYLEEQLRPFFPVDQHLISMQPTGIFGEYEKKNSLVLPVRLSNS